MAQVAFIGLGVMGYPMAGHLARAGHTMSVFNRTPARAKQWLEEYGNRAFPSPADAARDADVVFACVGRDADVEAVTRGADGAFQAMKKGAIFVDHTTASAGLARTLADAASAMGLGFVDAPVSGGEQGAKNGQLTIMCGGRERDYAKAEPVMAAYAKQCRRMGEA